MGTLRIYFNRRDELPWSVDCGDQSTEINVRAVQAHHVSFETVFDSTIKPNRDTPCAWLVARCAVLEVRDGVAHITQETYLESR